MRNVKKKAKKQRGRNRAVLKMADVGSLARKVESALARGDVDTACELLSRARPLPEPLSTELCARAFAAQAYARWDRPGRALDSLERAIELAPGRADLRRLRGNLLRRLGRIKPAIAELTEAHRLAPDDRQIAFELFLARLVGGERGENLERLVAALDGPEASRAAALLAARCGDLSSAQAKVASSQDYVDRLEHSLLLVIQGQAARAVPALEVVAAQEQLPLVARAYAHLYLGIAQAHRRQLKQAAQALGQARELGAPQDLIRAYQGWVLQQLAIDAVLDSDMPAAAQWFGRLEKLGGPEAVAARNNAGHALSIEGQARARAGDYDGAVAAWSQALAIAPRDAALRQNLAVALERAERTEEAIPHWQELVRQIPREVDKAAKKRSTGQEDEDEDALHKHIRAVAHQHLADLYLEQDEPERAIEQLERALRLVPSDFDARRNLAQLLMDVGRVAKAVPHLEQVAEAASASAIDHIELGVAYLAVEKEQPGIEQLEKALVLEPNYPAARVALGLALARRTLRHPKGETALGDARRAQELLPEKALTLGLLACGAAQLAQGDRRGAEKTLTQAVNKAQDKTAATIQVGQVYWDAGEREAAIAAWADAMKEAKKVPCAYAPLAEAWAKAGDSERCQECLLESLRHSEDEAIEAVERISRNRQMQPFIRQVLHNVIASTEDLVQRVYLAEGLIYAGDTTGGRTLLRSVAREAVRRDDDLALRAATNLDLEYNYTLLDGKTAGIVMDWIDANPSVID